MYITGHYQELYNNRDNTFGNAGLTKQIAITCIKNVDYRMSQMIEGSLTEQMRRTIEREDVPTLQHDNI